jgi:membrane fusion protein, multidrug efflux system
MTDHDTQTAGKSGSLGFRETAASRHEAQRLPRRGWVWVAVAAVVLIVAYESSLFTGSSKPVAKAPAIPVAATIVKRGNLDIYLSEIGTVTPFATVTLKSRVAGQILKIDFKEGELVKAGQLLINIDPKPYEAQLQQYEGQIERDKASLANARITFERYKDLFKQGVIARQDLDNQATLYNQAQGTVSNDEGLINGVKVNLSYCQISSPIAGRIGLRLVDLGNYVQATDSLVVITQLQPISVLFSISEDNIPQVVEDMRNGQQLPVQAWNRDLSKQIETGFLLTFDNQIDQTTGTIKLRAQFANQNYDLFPNQFVNARMLVKTIQNALLIPTAAIQRTPNGDLVYVVQQNSTVKQAQVKESATQGDVTALASGVNANDVVVTDGLDKLQPGSRVRVQLDNSASNQTASE